jgi:uncharacterized protein YcgI (DUF1989 family)
MGPRITIPARSGKAATMTAGQTVKVINTFGQQVVDTWAFRRDDITEFLSCEHTRATLRRLVPKPGDMLLSNRRRPILTLLEDTAGGVHDMLIAACDQSGYEELGCIEPHDNCADNLVTALRTLGLTSPATPSPLNLFMNIPWTPDGELAFKAPVSTRGSYVVLRAEMDLVMVFSACPQDILPTNGKAGIPTDAQFEIS